MALDYAYTGKTFATAGKDNIIRVYDEETKTITNKLTGIKWQTHGHNNRIFSLKFKPDDANILVSGGWDQNVNSFLIFRLMSGISERPIQLPPFSGLKLQEIQWILEIILS